MTKASRNKYIKGEIDSTYQIMPDMDPDEYEQLKESIQKFGVLDPICFDENEHCIDGHHRLKICKELGIDNFPVVVRFNADEQQKLEMARDLNVARRQLTREQKREIMEKELIANPQISDRQLAEQVGVDHKTVGAARARLEDSGEIPHAETVTDTQGRQQPRDRERKEFAEKWTPEALKAGDYFRLQHNSMEAFVCGFEYAMGTFDLDCGVDVFKDITLRTLDELEQEIHKWRGVFDDGKDIAAEQRKLVPRED